MGVQITPLSTKSTPKQLTMKRPHSIGSSQQQPSNSNFHINVNCQPTLFQSPQSPPYGTYHNGAQSPEPYQSITPLVGFNGVQIAAQSVDNAMYSETKMLSSNGQNAQTVPMNMYNNNKQRRQSFHNWNSPNPSPSPQYQNGPNFVPMLRNRRSNSVDNGVVMRNFQRSKMIKPMMQRYHTPQPQNLRLGMQMQSYSAYT